jgi:endonuclease/exonuclease/phosphatase family metal-dependent hydrolase
VRPACKARAALAVAVLALAACTTSTGNLRDYSREPRAAAVTEIKVLSYNIRLAAGTDDYAADVYRLPWGKNLSGVVAAIKSIDADVVALQEVAGSSQAKALASALNMNYAYTGHQTGSSRASWWGVAILSKFPILESRGTPISYGVGNSKSIVIATLDLAGKPCTLVSVHKDKDLFDGSSVRNILSAIEGARGPVLIAGDFNIQPGDRRLDLLSPRFVDTATAVSTPSARAAVTRGTGFGRIDYVFSEAASFSVLDAGLMSEPHDRASDHIGYWTRLSLR